MYRDNNNRTLRIKRLLVAITAVLLALSLMTTISYDAFVAYAEGEEAVQTETPAAVDPAAAAGDPA